MVEDALVCFCYSNLKPLNNIINKKKSEPIDGCVTKKRKRLARKKHPKTRNTNERTGGRRVVAVIKSRKTDSVKQSHLS